MKILVLSGVGGSSNWLPLVLPLDGLVLVIYSIDFLIKYIKKRKLHNKDKLITNATEPANNNDIVPN